MSLGTAGQHGSRDVDDVIRREEEHVQPGEYASRRAEKTDCRDVALLSLLSCYIQASSQRRSRRSFAQETINNASLSGRVTDATGAVVGNAAVTAREISTNLAHTTVTSSTGRFHFPYLPAGSYEVTIHRAGFSDALRPVTLTIGAAFDLPVVLGVGSAQSTIDVNAEVRSA